MTSSISLDMNQDESYCVVDDFHPIVEYHAGRLLAICQHIQDTADPDVGRTLVDSYFGTASTFPGLILPRIVKVANFRLRQIGIGVLKKELDALMTRVFCQIQEAPKSVLRIGDQGTFQLGFYHQRSCVPRYNNRNRIATLDGTAVKSYGEQLIANILFRNGVKYGYEKPLVVADHNSKSGSKELKPDFKVESRDGGKVVYIEYTGAMGAEGYAEQWNYKRACFSRLGARTVEDVECDGKSTEMTLIEVRPEDIYNARKFQSQLIRRIVLILGNGVVSVQNSCDQATPF